MKFLGIDYGSKRIGLATTDESATLAFPKEIIANDKNSVFYIGQILQDDDIKEIVIGESLDFSGKANPIEEKINSFILELKNNFGATIHREKEFLTSVEARKAGTTKGSFQKSEAHSKMKKVDIGKVDAGAAALILQRFLDKINH